MNDSIDEQPDKEDEFPRAKAPAGNRRALSHLWLISYSDFMTILMIFFLGMYGYTYLAKVSMMSDQPKPMTYSEFAREMEKLKGDLGGRMEIDDNVKKIEIQMPDDVLFQSGRAELNASAKGTIEELAKSIKLVAGQIVVEGHTDNVPIRGGAYPSNWELSAARAFSVIDALLQRGVEPERLSAWGFGEHRPVASNANESGRRKNRRIGLVLIKDDDQI